MSRLSDAVLAIASCIGYWPGQEASGTTIEDAESTNDVTSVGATLGAASLVPTDPDGTSISFDGTDDYLIRELPAALKVDPIAIMCVFRVPTSLPTGLRTLVSLTPRGASSNGRGVWLATSEASGVTKIAIRKGTGDGSWELLTGDIQLAADTTYMLFVEAGAGAVGVKMWLADLAPVLAAVRENKEGGTWNTDTQAIAWTDHTAGAPDPGQMYVAAMRSSSAAGTVPDDWFGKVLMSHVAIFDGTLDDTQRTTLYTAATQVTIPVRGSRPAHGLGHFAYMIRGYR